MPELEDQWSALRKQPTQELLNQIVRRVVERFQPQKIILFGSHAYGRPHPDSDVDLLERVQKRCQRVKKGA